ncbi:hypothetical protein [Crocosphaera chwakensis]|uniref:Predicted glycosyltransferase n=1 Tax=Crocosphaera chwakensis CCY0110 TaxID=391612 RepID=A3IZU0_9CHRO|nr:hypothetical protein [Crocosphaera chwakensis]EAZ88005.1 predicted glycosyltransferase [Crocosphaera chwakensis CCY0110]
MKDESKDIIENQVERLNALGLSKIDQETISGLVPELKSIAKDYGKFNFSLERTYKKNQLTENEANQENRNFLFTVSSKLNNKLFIVMWLIVASIAASLNMKAAQTVVPDSWGNGETTISFIVSLCFIIFIDIIIASQVTFFYNKQDAEQEQKIKFEYLGKVQNQSNGVVTENEQKGEKEVLEKVQGKYLDEPDKDKKLPFDVKLNFGILGIYFSVEFFASIYDIITYDTFNIIALAIPISAALLNLMSGYLRGMTIVYPRNKKKIRNHYQEVHSKIDKKKLVQDIKLMNYLTKKYKENGNISHNEIEKIKTGHKTWLKLKEMRRKFEKDLSNVQSKNTDNDSKKQLIIVANIIQVLEKFKNEVEDLISSSEYFGLDPDMLNNFSNDIKNQYTKYQGELTKIQSTISKIDDREKVMRERERINDVIKEHQTIIKNYKQEYHQKIDSIINTSLENYSLLNETIKSLDKLNLEIAFIEQIITQIKRTQGRLKVFEDSQDELISKNVNNQIENLKVEEIEYEQKIENLKKTKFEKLLPKKRILELEKFGSSLRSKFKKEESNLKSELSKKKESLIGEYQQENSGEPNSVNQNRRIALGNELNLIEIEYLEEIIEIIKNYIYRLEGIHKEIIELKGDILVIQRIINDFQKDTEKYENMLREIEN